KRSRAPIGASAAARCRSPAEDKVCLPGSWRLFVQVHTAPQFKVQQNVDEVIVVVASGGVFLDQPVDVIRIEKAAAFEVRFAKQIADHFLQIGNNPGADRRSKAGFFPVQNVSWQQSAK